MKDISSQPEPFASLRIAQGEIILAGAGNIEALGNQAFDHARPVFDLVIRDPIQQPVVNFLPGRTTPEIFDDRRDIASTIWVHWISPAMFFVQTIAKGIIRISRSGRRNVERAPRV
nr:hypothetical protein [Ochrobactrum sp. SFR4]